MRLSDKLALIGAILVSIPGVSFAAGPIFREIYLPQISAWNLPVAVTGWVFATYGPIAVAAFLWRGADRFSHGWLLHLLLIPFLYAVFLLGNRMMLAAINDPDFDGTIGAPIMPAILCVITLIGVYVLALAVKQIMKSRRFRAGS